ncbi:MAG: prepilin-type N-terminal cleavage/methylation domain-containing protein [Candidatus Xenobiia bacterium LiM19]
MVSSKRGFSLVELMVAIFILSSSLLLIIGLFTFLFNSSRKGIDLTAGVAAAELMMEEYLYRGASDIYNSTTGEFYAQDRAINGVNFHCEIVVSSPVGNLRKVDATVYWWVNADGSPVESKKYLVQKEDGTFQEVTTGKGYVAEYGATKTKLTKLLFLTGE